MTYEFSVPGRPHPCMRARLNGHGGVYDPARNRVAKADIALSARAAGVRPMSGAVEIWINFAFRRPKSHLRKDGTLKPSAPVHHLRVPDLDNLVKTVKDGLKGIAWRDDCQVVGMHVDKCWTMDSISETLITIETVEGN